MPQTVTRERPLALRLVPAVAARRRPELLRDGAGREPHPGVLVLAARAERSQARDLAGALERHGLEAALVVFRRTNVRVVSGNV